MKSEETELSDLWVGVTAGAARFAEHMARRGVYVTTQGCNGIGNQMHIDNTSARSNGDTPHQVLLHDSVLPRAFLKDPERTVEVVRSWWESKRAKP